jgi:hypothetical protein
MVAAQTLIIAMECHTCILEEVFLRRNEHSV